jgi:SAM-dependent methyltransferase
VKYNERSAGRLVTPTMDFAFLSPVVRRILRNVAGRDVLDLGCGSGRYSRLAAQLGGNVVGIDRSGNQIAHAIAQERADPLGIEYRHADILSVELDRASFDVVLLMFVLLDVPRAAAVEEIAGVASRALIEGGRIVIADVHPHNVDRPNALEHFQLKQSKTYFDNGAEAFSETRFEDKSPVRFDPNFHYRLDFLLNCLSSRGFCLKELVELEGSAPFPTHMAIDAQRL